MTAVFVDTVGMIAVWNSTDQWHVAADAAYRALMAHRRPFITTDLVFSSAATPHVVPTARESTCCARRSWPRDR